MKRAQLKETSLIDTVREWIEKHPGKTSREVSEGMRMDIKRVQNIICCLRRKGVQVPVISAAHSVSPAAPSIMGASFTKADILAVKRIGPAKVREILRLIELLS
jgi:hypothetical protein